MIEDIKEKISKSIDTFHLNIIDESPNHGGYSGNISHVKIIIVSDEFIGLNLIKRHKLVYAGMGEYVEKIHAISIVAKTVEQWKQSEDYIPSPDCAHN